jgi:hypothetical protein
MEIEQLSRLLRLAAGERETARRGQSSSPKRDEGGGTRLGPTGSLARNVKFGFT